MAAWIGEETRPLVMQDALQAGHEEFIAGAAANRPKTQRFAQRGGVEERPNPGRYFPQIWCGQVGRLLQ